MEGVSQVKDNGAGTAGRDHPTQTTTVEALAKAHLGSWVTFTPLGGRKVAGVLHEILTHIAPDSETATLVLLTDLSGHGDAGVWVAWRTTTVTVSW